MADTPGTPDAPDTLTSYSDPLYDRLEGVVKAMGRKWWVIVLMAAIFAGAAVMLQQQAERVPEAASANAYLEALDEEGSDALAAVADNAEILPEFRARAALEAADRALAAGDAERAASLLATADTQAGATALKDLQLTVAASQAAVLEEQGQFEDAAARYTQVADKSAAAQPGLNLVATLGAARCNLALSAAAEDPELKAELLAVAHEQFVFASERDITGVDKLTQYARFQRYDLERRHPELIGGEPLPTPVPEAAPSEDAPGEDAADADAEPAEEAADAEAEPAEAAPADE